MSHAVAQWGVMQPAVKLMRHLRLPAKMGLIVALIALPLGLLVANNLHLTNEQLTVTRDEAVGAQAVARLLDVAVATQTHRGQTNLAMSGNTPAEQALPATRDRMKQAINQAQALLEGQPGWGLTSQWRAIADALAPLAAGQRSGDRAAVFAAHTQQIKALNELIGRVGESSSLLFDPEAGSFFLMDISVTRMLPMTEVAGLLRGQGAGLIGKGEATPQEMAAVSGRIALLREQLSGLQHQIEALKRAGESAPAGFDDLIARNTQFADAATKAFAGTAPAGDAQAFFAAGTQAIEATVTFSRANGQRLSELLAARESRLLWTRNVAFGLAGLGIALLAYLLTGMYASVMEALHRVGEVTAAGARGDLTLRANVRGDDEFAVMGADLDRMSAQLAEIVRGIRQHAEEVASTGGTMEHQSQELASRTTEQAATVEESAATLEQIAQTARSNASHVDQVDQLFQQVRATGSEGREMMGHAVRTIEGIAATSRRVGEIVQVIDGIAFQTNILALNAAVEAARAGESGRGFAVVAGEVRALAQRSATAAGEIRQLIGTSAQQVEAGVGEIHQASDNMRRILEQVDGVGEAVNQLSVSTREQTLAVDQVTEAVRQIGDVTQHNAHSAETASGAAGDMRARADGLNQLVNQLRVTA